MKQTGAFDIAVGAIDVGATKVLVGIADEAGNLVPNRYLRFSTPSDSSQFVAQVVNALNELTIGHTLGLVSCAAPGPLDSESGVIINTHNRGWVAFSLGPELSARLGVPVILEDDATAAAVGEAIQGAGAGYNPVAYLTISTGVGAGLVFDGKVLRGAHGLAGEVGHLVIDPMGPRCGCGNNGDIESFTGGLSLASRAREFWPESHLADGTLSPRTAEDVFRLADTREDRALSIVYAAQHAIAFAIATLASSIDPERIVVGGSIALGQPDLIQASALSARKLCIKETGLAIDVVLAALGDRSALAGAALLGAARLGLSN